jgi:site-specific DNA recombinase
MTPTHTRRHGRLYRYYICMGAIRKGAASCPVRSVPAAQIEGLVLDQVRGLLRAPEVVARVSANLADQDVDLPAEDRDQLVQDGFRNLDAVWDELFPAEQSRILQLLIDEVRISPEGANVHLRDNGLTRLSDELTVSAGG